MFDLHLAVADRDPYNLPTFADQGNCPQFDPEGDEAMAEKHTLVELIANTRLNQALSIHPTTDAIALRVENENKQILLESTRDFLASYDDENSLIRLRRMESFNGINYLTIALGRRSQSLALEWHPRNELKQEHAANKATSSTPVELSRVPHYRFGSVYTIQQQTSNLVETRKMMTRKLCTRKSALVPVCVVMTLMKILMLHRMVLRMRMTWT